MATRKIEITHVDKEEPEDIERILLESENYETSLFFQMAKKFYDECSEQSEDLFDLTSV